VTNGGWVLATPLPPPRRRAARRRLRSRFHAKGTLSANAERAPEHGLEGYCNALSQLKTKPLQRVRLPPVREAARQHRTLDERILVRFPALARLLLAGWARLPRHSRLRRVMLVRQIRQGYAAANRRDLDLVLTGLDPGIEYRPSEAWQFDFDPLYHGHDGYLQVWRVLLESFEDVRLDPEELLDLGNRFLVTLTLSGQGVGSGVAVSEPHYQVFTLRRGLVVRQDDFQDRAQALETAGLSEQDAHSHP
jgi:hypothetical protein